MTSLKNKFREEFLKSFREELFKEELIKETPKCPDMFENKNEAVDDKIRVPMEINMNKWIKVPKEEDECIGIVVHNKELDPLVILHTLKDASENKAYVCASDNGFRLLTKEGDANWNESPLPKELIDLVY